MLAPFLIPFLVVILGYPGYLMIILSGRDCRRFLQMTGKIIANDFYYNLQGNKSDKERNELSFMHTKRFNTTFKRWVQFRVDAIPRLPNRI